MNLFDKLKPVGKLKPIDRGPIKFAGCLTDIELLELVSQGWRLAYNHNGTCENALRRKKAALVPHVSWYYFKNPKKEVLSQMNAISCERKQEDSGK